MIKYLFVGLICCSPLGAKLENTCLPTPNKASAGGGGAGGGGLPAAFAGQAGHGVPRSISRTGVTGIPGEYPTHRRVIRALGYTGGHRAPGFSGGQGASSGLGFPGSPEAGTIPGIPGSYKIYQHTGPFIPINSQTINPNQGNGSYSWR